MNSHRNKRMIIPTSETCDATVKEFCSGRVSEELLSDLLSFSRRPGIFCSTWVISVTEMCVNAVKPGSELTVLASTLISSFLKHQITTLPLDVNIKVLLWHSASLCCVTSKDAAEEECESNAFNNQLVLILLESLELILKQEISHNAEVYPSLAGMNGCLLVVLRWQRVTWRHRSCVTRCLNIITFVSPDALATFRHSGGEALPSEVVAAVQSAVVRILHLAAPAGTAQIVSWYLCSAASCLSVLYNLVLCAPSQVLISVCMSTCCPFGYYGLPGLPRVEVGVDGEHAKEKIYISLPISSSGVDSDSPAKNYTNKNRIKRLKRKKAQPSKSAEETSVILDPKDAQTIWTRQHVDVEQNVAHSESRILNSCEGARYQCMRIFSAAVFEDRDCNALADIEDEQESVLMSRVRLCSLQTINAVIDTIGKQNKFAFWPMFMCQNPSLMTIILRDPSPSVRIMALQVLSTFLTESTQVLTMVVDSASECRGPYGSLGDQLGSSLCELHRCLALALLSEKFSVALVKTLKTAEVLVQNVNYAKLKKGLLTKLVTHVKPTLRSKDLVVQASGFSLMTSVLMIKPSVPEVEELLLRYQLSTPLVRVPVDCTTSGPEEEEIPDDEIIYEEVADEIGCIHLDDATSHSFPLKTEETKVSWLVQRCVDCLLYPEPDSVQGVFIQVQLQSLKVFNALVTHHLKLIHETLPLIQKVISLCCRACKSGASEQSTMKGVQKEEARVGSGCTDILVISTEPEVLVEHSYNLLSSLLSAVKGDTGEGDMFYKDTTSVSNEDATQLWLWALQDPLYLLFQMNYADVKLNVAMASVLPNLSLQVFACFNEEWKTRLLCTVSWLLKSYQSELLQLAGVRVVAVVVSFPSVVGHPMGIELLRTSVEIIAQMLNMSAKRDRLAATVAMTNISAALEIYSCEEKYTAEEVLSTDLLKYCLNIGISACYDKDRVKPHGVRCCGNIVRFLRPAALENVSQLVAQAVAALIACATIGNNMKTRWNACHALGTLITSPYLCLSQMPWRKSVLTSLCLLVEDFKNYKVRIHACIAVCGLNCRENFGAEFGHIWRVLLQAMDNVQNIVDYQEVRHRDEFVHQICQGLCQLMCHMTLGDTSDMFSTLQPLAETAEAAMRRAFQALLPERASLALTAHHCVCHLRETDALTESQQEALNACWRLTNAACN